MLAPRLIAVVLTLAMTAMAPLGGAAPKSSSQTAPADLVASVWHSPTTPRDGDVVSLGVHVYNAGGKEARATVLDVYLDGGLHTRLDVPGLAPGAYFVHSFTVILAAGTHTAEAVADAAGRLREPDESNNRATDVFEVAPRLPDLVLLSIYSSPSAKWTDTPVTLHLSVINYGDATAGSSTVTLALDDGTTYSLATPALAPGAWSALAQPLGTRPAGTTVITLAADVGNAVEERNETNNAASHAFVVQERRADLVVVGATNGPHYGGDPLRFVVGVRNQGQASAPATVLRAHWDDGAPPMDLAFPPLDPGETLHIGVWRDAPTAEGDHEVRFEADATLLVAEWDEANNGLVHAFTVLPPQPDLVVMDLWAEPSNETTGTQALMATVANLGSATAGASMVRFEIDGQVHEEPVPELPRDATVDVTITVPSNPNGYNVTVTADAGGAVTELSEDNNTRTGFVPSDGSCLTAPECGS
jgi:subtilase family serine protease